jgi:CRISP-associated protein Cas1
MTTQGAYLNKEGESVVVSVEREVRLRVPIHTLGGIVCFGNVMCSPFLMHHCAENNVLISFLSENGRFPGACDGPGTWQCAAAPPAIPHGRRSGGLCRSGSRSSAGQGRQCPHRFAAGRAGPHRQGWHGGGGCAVERIGMLMRGIENERDLEAIRGREGDISRFISVCSITDYGAERSHSALLGAAVGPPWTT